MKLPKVSVIIPVYNAEKTIGGILEKLIAQEYSNIEIITVNDGSKDASLAILNSFSDLDNRIVVVDQENGGVSVARNVGLRIANGEFVTFIDSDDDIDPDLIQELVRCIDDADISVCGMTLNGRDITVSEEKICKQSLVTGYVLKSMLTRNLFYGPYCKLFRRSIIRDYGIQFPEGVGYGEDTIFVLKYLKHSASLRMINKSLYKYNLSDDGLAATNAANIGFRKDRTCALNEYMKGDRTVANWVLYALVRVRWSLATLKTKYSVVRHG